MNEETHVTNDDWITALGRASRTELPRSAIRPAEPEDQPTSAEDLDLPDTMGRDHPRVSVIIPTYGDSRYLPDALQSVAAQTMTDLEVVIVDSSQTAWVRELARIREWITYRTSPPAGVGRARNDGIEAASGEYVAFLDADDYWHPEKLERQLDAMDDGAATSFTGYFFINHWAPESPDVTAEDIQATAAASLPTALIHRELDAHISTMLCAKEVLPDRPFEEDLSNFEDVLFAIEQFHDHPPAWVREPLAVRRLRPESLADRTDDIAKCRDRIEAYRRLGDWYPELEGEIRPAIARETYRRGTYHTRRGDHKLARNAFLRSLSDHPSPLKPLARYVATFLPLGASEILDRVPLRPAVR